MRAVVFDLDGTLIDSAPDLRAAANRMLAEAGAAPLTLAEVTSFIGNGVPKLVERAMAARGLDTGDHPAMVARFMAFYDADPATLTRLYPNVAATLARLCRPGLRLGVCTNKPEAPARAILDTLGIGAGIDAVVGGDSLAVGKPDPAPLQRCVAALGATTALYVGDSEVDAETAGRAGLPFALFTEGYRKAPVSALPHDARFADFAELPGIVDRLLPLAA